MSDLRLHLFGMPRIEYQGSLVKIERRKALALAAYLAMAERSQSREIIADLMWPSLDHTHARSALRSTRRARTTPVPIAWIRADRSAIGLERDRIWIDVRAFTSLLDDSRAHDHGPDVVCDGCADSHHQAIALYQADFLDGFSLTDSVDYDDWQLAQRQWLRQEIASVHRRLSDYYAQRQDFGRAIDHAQGWLAIDVLHEPAHRQLMTLYTASGQRSEALRQYQQCVTLLDAELVTVPDEETTRLYRTILENQPTDSAAPTGLAPTLASGVMPPLPSLTVGREAALTEIKQRLGIGTAAAQAVTVIQGWPGVGKSTTVALLAHDPDVAQHFPDGVLWASLGENPSLLVEISVWADTLIPDSGAGRARRVEEISAQLTSLLRDRRVLLIVDDVWQAEHAQPFRVGGQHCALVMTTRLNDVASALTATASDVYRLPVLAEGAALELLSKLTPETLAEYPDDARELVRDLEGLPLAIQVAGRLLHSESHLGWGVKDLLAELRSGSGLLKAQAPGDMLGAGKDTSPTVAALLKRSTDLLDVDTRRQFAYLGLFVPKPATFDLEAMAAAWDVEDPRPVARILVNRGLLEPISSGRFQMHALLVMHARTLPEHEDASS